jgi:oxygen-independent coproporphyrinogen-3 oxidase
MQGSLSLYIHIPFCRHRCAYCDFNTYAGLDEYIPDYIEALCAEIGLVAARAGERLRAHTLFFGGGTPSLLPAASVEKVLGACRRHFDLLPEAEISLEANPGTVTREWLAEVRASGVNRISFGMQSAHPGDLRILERQHDAIDVIRAVEWSRQEGFENLSMDLIFGIPAQDLQRWIESLDFALRLNPEHLSLYSLTIESGTPFKRWVERGLVGMPDEDLAADMYEEACQRLDQAGYAHYEISNWARRDRGGDYRCQHNLQYWLMDPYLGFGAGAHGYAAHTRTANVRGVKAYIHRCAVDEKRPFPAGPAADTLMPLDRWIEMQEMMMVGLRLLEDGVSAADFQQRFGLSMKDAFGRQIAGLIQVGLLEWAGEGQERLRLTRHGWLLGNRVFREFIDLPKPEALT